MTPATTVVNITREKCDVYIGRPSVFGNPFIIRKGVGREQVIDKYRRWLQTRPEILARLPELRGKRLGCYCAPLACHGDVLAELADVTGEQS